MLEVSRLIAEVHERHGIRLQPDDVGFALITLNQLMLEDLARRLTEGVRAEIAEFNNTVLKTEVRAGKMLAQQVTEAGAALRQQLQQDVETARIMALEMVCRVDQSHRRAQLVRWSVTFVIAAIAVFSLGIWAGSHAGH